MSNFLDNNNIISDSQHGFRRGRSTATALAGFTDFVNESLDQRKQLVVIFIDFKKAFETLEHHQLLQAMDECGIRGPLKQWFKAYSHDRKLQTVIDGKIGKKFNITYGVPTGSVYGPIGYSIHVNSMCNVIKHCKAFMYADDTCLMYADRDLNVIQQKLQEDFDSIMRWSHDNGIIINLSKTKCMHIYSPYSRVYSTKPVLIGHSYDCLHSKNSTICSCNVVEVVDSYKYLGLTIDSSFSWKKHVDNVSSKLRLTLEKFYHLKFIVNRATLYTVYYTLAESIISYGVSSYGRTFKSYLDQIKLIQIRFLKLLVDKQVKENCKGDYLVLFKLCKILPIHDKVSLMIALEEYRNTEFKTYAGHSYTTRSVTTGKYVVPRTNNYYGQRTRRYLVPKNYNKLDIDDNSMSKATFKKKVKEVLLSASYE